VDGVITVVQGAVAMAPRNLGKLVQGAGIQRTDRWSGTISITAFAAAKSTACFVILIRRKGKYGDIEILEIAGLLLFRIWFFFADQPISAEIPDIHSAWYHTLLPAFVSNNLEKIKKERRLTDGR
jgi:hypothetical protein